MHQPPIFVASLLAAASIATAQTGNLNLQRLTNGTYSRSHDYDLVHQRIAVRDFDWDSLSFVGQVVTTLVARRASLDSVIVDAGSRLEIRSVTTPRRAALRSNHRGDTLVVFLDKPARTGDTVRLPSITTRASPTATGSLSLPSAPTRRARSGARASRWTTTSGFLHTTSRTTR